MCMQSNTLYINLPSVLAKTLTLKQVTPHIHIHSPNSGAPSPSRSVRSTMLSRASMMTSLRPLGFRNYLKNALSSPTQLTLQLRFPLSLPAHFFPPSIPGKPYRLMGSSLQAESKHRALGRCRQRPHPKGHRQP